MYFRARYYDPLTGEFVSRDPIGYVDGTSMYRGYFAPKLVDPTGNVCKPPKKKCEVTDGPRFNYVGPLVKFPKGLILYNFFRFIARFKGDCECCEVRLKVKWDEDWFDWNDKKPPHEGFKPPDDQPGDFVEDRDINGRRYGHRSNPGKKNDKYVNRLGFVNQKFGCTYRGYDRPTTGMRNNFKNVTGRWEFMLEVVDVCTDTSPPPVIKSSDPIIIDWSGPTTDRDPGMPSLPWS